MDTSRLFIGHARAPICQVPENELDSLLEEKLIFLVDATGIPVLLSLLVLIFTSGGEDLTKLPSNRIELYELGIESAISKRLLKGGNQPEALQSTDYLVHEWMRLFNLDRGAMMNTSIAVSYTHLTLPTICSV